MGQWCQPDIKVDGKSTAWGSVDPEELLGPQGWCMAAEPKRQCDCNIDGGWGAKLAPSSVRMIGGKVCLCDVECSHWQVGQPGCSWTLTLHIGWLGAAGWGGKNCEEPYEQVGWGACLLA